MKPGNRTLPACQFHRRPQEYQHARCARSQAGEAPGQSEKRRSQKHSPPICV